MFLMQLKVAEKILANTTLYVSVEVCISHVSNGTCCWSDFFCLFQQLYLAQNNINFTHQYAFRGLKTLHTLDMTHNQLTSAPSLADAKFNLRVLKLTWNSIKHIRESYFKSFISITDIDIGNNELIQLPNLQNIAKTIVAFRVDGNRLSNANFIYGNRFPKLENLNLQSNQIRVFCPPPRKHCTTITFVIFAIKQAIKSTFFLWFTTASNWCYVRK